MKRTLLMVCALYLMAGAGRADLLDELRAADARADAAIAAIATPAELRAKQDVWRAAWLAGLGGLPETKTPLRPRVTGVVPADGFRIENIIFESQPGVYVSAHLALPTAKGFSAPYPAVLMPMGHSDNGLLNPRYATQLALGQPRVALATGSRWQDYFPHKGAEATFKVFSEMCGRLGFKGPYWHFHCDGPHGLPPPARAATRDWMYQASAAARAATSSTTSASSSGMMLE